MSDPVLVRGTVAPGFEAVRDEFAAAVAREPADPGAQLAVYRNGEQVVDLWGGDDVSGDTMTVVFSISKAATSLVVALLVQEGVLDLDAQVTTLPFALTLRELLGHRAGLVGVDGGFTAAEVADDQLIAARLRDQAPFWPPGSAYGYHSISFGALVGDHLEQVTGRTVQEVYRSRFQRPFDLDLYLGLPEDLERRYRVLQTAAVPRSPDPRWGPMRAAADDIGVGLVQFGNSRRVRELGQASAGGVGNARGVARLFAAAVTGVDGGAPLLTTATIDEFARTYSFGTDLVSGKVDHFGLGFEKFDYLPPEALAHGGAAGALGWGDPATGIAYGYVRRRFASGTTENEELVKAVIVAAESSQ